ncbi:MAG TPA: hypothetical protein DCZ71_02280 [Ruminococcus sp.]|nr:hypothetical protein [Ruminococcus sp.]
MNKPENRFRKIFGRMLSSSLDSVIYGTFCAVILYFVCSLVFAFMGYTDYLNGAALMLFFCMVGIVGAAVAHTKSGFHKYDPEIIGDCFVGYSKKCRLFSESLSDLFNHRVNFALNGFKTLESDYADKTDQREKGVLSFYIGRCYDVMHYFPNASRYYGIAENYGFSDSVLPLLKARCFAAMGDTDDALRIYTAILEDGDSPFRPIVRTDIGNMYLRKNDGKTALKWYSEAIELHENYAEAMGGAAIALTLQHRYSEAEEHYRSALLNHVSDPVGYTSYYKSVLEAARAQDKAADK